MSQCWSFVLNEENHLKKIADDIATISLFSPGCQIESSISALFVLLIAKEFYQAGIRIQNQQKLYFSANQSTSCETFSGIGAKSFSRFKFRGDQLSGAIFSLSQWFFQPCQTTGPVIYCASEAENGKYFRHKNYPNHVSNNYLVPTYK